MSRSLPIAAPVERVFDHWTRLERLPEILTNVRRVKRIGDRRSLWDVDVAGRQIVWEAEEVERIPHKTLRWVSTWGAEHRGCVGFTRLDDGGTRLDVEIEIRPRNLLERLGVWLGPVGSALSEDLSRFARFVEAHDPDSDPG
ncbi:MAG: hypothetical protein HKP30_12880 [Myxococcales bacterium]|nr:hypothetical protein [Myxococcales bacterium]